MEVDEDYMFEEQAMEELGIDSLDEGALVASDDLVEYCAGEDELEEETVYIKTEESFEEPAPQKLITSPNITVKRVINSKPIATPTNLTRIAPKPANYVRATNAAGKVVYIQKTPTTTAPVKLLNNTKSPTSTNTTSYHLVKSEAGVVMQPKAQTLIRRLVPATSTSSSHATVGLNRPKAVSKPATHVVIHTKMGPSGTTTTKTLTVAEAHQMGLLNNKAKQVIQMAKPKPTGISSAVKSPVKVLSGGSASANSSTIVRLKQSPGATSAGQVQRITTVTKPQSHKVVLPQSAVQAGQQSGQIQAINIPGKGIQYVRFLNQSVTSDASTSAQKMVQVMNKTGNAVSASSGSKVVVQNNKTFIVNNGKIMAVRSASGQSASQNRVLTSGSQSVVRKVLATSGSQSGVLRRDQDSTRYIAVVRKEDGKSTEAITNLTASQLNQLSGTTVMAGSSKTKIVMLPSSSTSQLKTSSSGGSSSSSSSHHSSNPAIISVKLETDDDTRKGPAVGTIFPDEAYKKRPCNCTKSQCLKLYCDCFANGEFCYNCNCRDCYNNLDNEEERQKAIRATLERNPSAFKPKIGAVSAEEDALRLHTKGCNCKRSGCLKNYCECYEAKIACSANCKCIGCRNTEQYAKEFEYATSLAGSDSVGGVTAIAAEGAASINLDHLSGDDSMAEVSQNDISLGASIGIGSSDIKPLGAGISAFAENKPTTSSMAATASAASGVKRPSSAELDLTQLPPSKQPYNFMTPDVIEATVQCMIAQADECQKRGCNIRTAERMILEEFGRCLVEIIEFSSKSDS